MASSSSHVLPQSLCVDSQAALSRNPDTSALKASQLRLVEETPVDFESFRVNGLDVRGLFEDQGWLNYFDLLNGPIYPILVKEFWLGAKVVTKEVAQREYNDKVAEDPEENKGKTREELGLESFDGKTVIRSTILGMPSRISRKTIFELLNIVDQGKFLINTDKPHTTTKYRAAIKDTLYEDKSNMGKTSGLHKKVKLLHKILISTMIPRVGGSDQVSWD